MQQFWVFGGGGGNKSWPRLKSKSQGPSFFSPALELGSIYIFFLCVSVSISFFPHLCLFQITAVCRIPRCWSGGQGQGLRKG